MPREFFFGVGALETDALPDLLAALEDILPRYIALRDDWHEKNPGGAIIGGVYTVEKARSAIAKARRRDE